MTDTTQTTMKLNAANFRAVGKPIPRMEDERLITGHGRFSDDFNLDGQAHAVMVRSPHPHARIGRIDAARVKPLPGVYHSEDAMQPDAPAIWDEVPYNVPVDTWFGDRAATDQAFAGADHVVAFDFHIDRVTGVPLEPRAALAAYH